MDLGGVAAAFERTILSGSLLAALPVALIAGFVSFASPCVLPLVPGYLGYVGGMTGIDLGAAQTRGSSGVGPASRGRLLAGVLMFVAGFSAVFVALSLVFVQIGASVQPWMDVVLRVLGVVVILLGLAFMGFVPFLQRERRLHVSPRAGLWGAPLLGVVFGLGWAPCIGPTLGAITILALPTGEPARGAVLALAYCLGLGLPFVLIALAFRRSAGALGFLRRHRLAIMRIGGGLLILLGIALVSGLWMQWSQYLQGLVDGFETVV
ncbi:cytochrome c biogenesis protein transmembrane region [Beutenbergia cavernae DSM 12333]|uniref:Cytochrome c biogenesis protein transmembrane region n=1 Tax=Beutenbergia cavernae (strain ATCC BAA-8 / DSM 12333 / CCUG 43141 / JCM 11478 / NBRC 16432 / NCIMB 13614 / HKI 0122) TaxID=471853 RepID=C5C186_BEUC1|nr:cytochrome c biogenesis CcdA family protein [Beutenbergia cavernae]ACQ81496.1 cytochrome c biogenesis protein transmembrane region [Beutenbergia cavernae DSM 12333]